MQSREHLNSWQQLTKHAQQMKNEHMKDLFAADKLRFNKFSIKLPSILLDYSKNTITEQTLSLLTDLAKECDVETWREKMFTGVRINKTEDRAVLHTALRNNSKTPMMVDGNDISQDIEKTLAQIKSFSDNIRQGQWKGYSGERITDIVNIGVGGSNLNK